LLRIDSMRPPLILAAQLRAWPWAGLREKNSASLKCVHGMLTGRAASGTGCNPLWNILVKFNMVMLKLKG
jgi:hypothetical protein